MSIKKFFTPIICIALACVILECLFRVLFALNLYRFPEIKHDHVIHKYADDPRLVYDMKPSFKITDSHLKEIQTNSFGMRDKEYTMKKPDGVYRIAVLGDSVSFGIYLEQFYTFADLLEKKLNEQNPEKFEVLNFSVTGYNAKREEIVLNKKILSFEPDMVILSFCFNDTEWTSGLGGLARELAPNALGSRLNSLALSGILRATEKNIYSKLTDWGQVQNLFQSLKQTESTHNTENLVLVFPYYYERKERYPLAKSHTRTEKLLNATGLPFLDFFKIWENLDTTRRKDYYHPQDTVHFSENGMRDITNHIYDYLSNKIPAIAQKARSELARPAVY